MAKYSLLRRKRIPGTRAPFDLARASTLGGASEPRETYELQLEHVEMTKKDVLDQSRDPAVVALAPVLPMRLIEPVAMPSTNATAPWGIPAVLAHSSHYDGTGVTVAVLDTGIDDQHKAFAGASLIQQDFTGEGNGDAHGHGTHCAGTIFGRDVDGQRIGIARGVTRALIGKVLGANGGGSTEQIQRAILWAVNQGAHVISMSLGIDFSGAVKSYQESRNVPIEAATAVVLDAYRANVQAFDALFELARSGVATGNAPVIVAASGNSSDREAPRPYRISAGLPAAAHGVISVAAVGRRAEYVGVAPFSNTFPQVSGPGVSILSAKRGGGLTEMSGTSMATPHVAGIAALWWQKLGTATDHQFVTAKIIGTCRGDKDVFGPAATDPSDIGAGLVTAPQ